MSKWQPDKTYIKIKGKGDITLKDIEKGYAITKEEYIERKEGEIMKRRTPKWLSELATKLGKEDGEAILRRIKNRKMTSSDTLNCAVSRGRKNG